MTTVRWRQWVETWRHVSAGAFGCYEDRSKEFATPGEACAFLQGLHLSPHAREITMTPGGGR
jgi:hypothetical protein